MFTSKFLTRIATIVIVVMLALGSMQSAGAAGTVTVTLQSTRLKLTNRLLVTVPVVIVCDPLPNTPAFSQVSVSIQQASGQRVNRGFGTVSSFGSSFLTCDGTTTNLVMVQVLPDANSGPFHGGSAFVSASATYSTGESCGVGCFFNTQSESGTSGLLSVRLR
jgi:hypothetical protein